MKTIGLMFGCTLLAACGGSKGGGAKAPVPVAEDHGPDMNETYEASGPSETAPPIAGLQDGPVSPIAFPAKIEPAPERLPVLPVAAADLVSMKDGSAIGVVTFEQGADDRITISGDFSGLGKDSVRAFYVHEIGDCSSKGKKVGGRLDPTKAKHGPPASSQRHAGDLGDLTSDADGHARFSMVTDSVTMEEGRADSVIGRAVVIHVKKDSKKGNAGDAFACGVIVLVDGI